MLRSIRDLDAREKRVLLRVDYNVPMKDGKIIDDTRIRESLPTINYLLSINATIIILSHLGRPKGIDEKYRLDPVAKHLSKLAKKQVIKLDDCIGEEIEEKITRSRPGQIILLENLRFYPQEEQNDPKFAQSLAELGDIYVNDAFSVSHRAHASVEAITRFIPSGAGFLLEREIERLSTLSKPTRPFIAILGGSKISDKIGLISTLGKRADFILIGGAMMFAFLAARGYTIGKSLVEKDRIPLAKTILKTHGRKILLPIDVQVTIGKKNFTCPANKIPQTATGLDIGPKTAKLFIKQCTTAATIFWNGPLGYVEDNRFAKGTKNIIRALSKMKSTRMIGGGDTIAIANQLKLAKKFTHVSTGGGASLEFIEGKQLPGITALTKK